MAGQETIAHALTSITGTYNGVTNPAFAYDANGNLTSGGGRTLTWTSFNMAATITQGSNSLALVYDSEHSRIKQCNGTTTIGIKCKTAACSKAVDKIESDNSLTNVDIFLNDGSFGSDPASSFALSQFEGINGAGTQVAQLFPLACVGGPIPCAAAAGITAGEVLLGGTAIVGGAAIILHNKKSPDIDASEVAGKNATEIDEAARAQGLIPKGPDPANGQGAYVDPVTGEQRILVHPDPNGGGHVHVNDPSGQRLDVNGNPVDPNSPAAHLPLGQ